MASASVSVLSGMDRLAAEAGNGVSGGGGTTTGSSSGSGGGGKATKFFRALGFGATKQEDSNEYTHMRSVTEGTNRSSHSTTIRLKVMMLDGD